MINTSKILLSIGRYDSKREILGSGVLAALTFFYIYTVASFFGLVVFLLQNRVTYSFIFEVYLIDPYFDHLIIALCTSIWLGCSSASKKRTYMICTIYSLLTLIAIALSNDWFLEIVALISAPIIAGILIYTHYQSRGNRYQLAFNKNIYLTYSSIIALYIAGVSLVVSLGPFVSSNLDTFLGNYAYNAYLIISWLSPISMVLLICCFPVKLVISRITQSLLKIDQAVTKIPGTLNQVNAFQVSGRSFVTIFSIISIMITSSILAYIPHSSVINEDNQIIGIDTPAYTNWTKEVLISSEEGPTDLLTEAFLNAGIKGDRPLSVLFLFLVAKFTTATDLSHVIDALPILLAPLLVLAISFMVNEMTMNKRISVIAALLTAVSFQVLVGIYAGFYANWFALIIGYTCIGFLFRFLRNPLKRYFWVFSGLLIAMLLAHVYTWSILTVVIALFLIVMLKLNYYPRQNLILILTAVLVVVFVDISKSIITGTNAGVEEDIKIAMWGIGLDNISEMWTTLSDTVRSFLGGLFANSVILLLALYWVFRSNYKLPSNLLIFIFLSVGLLPLFFGDWVILSRVIYNVPFQVPAAIAMEYILTGSSKIPKVRLYSLYRLLTVAAICLWLVSMSIVLLSDFSPA